MTYQSIYRQSLARSQSNPLLILPLIQRWDFLSLQQPQQRSLHLVVVCLVVVLRLHFQVVHYQCRVVLLLSHHLLVEVEVAKDQSVYGHQQVIHTRMLFLLHLSTANQILERKDAGASLRALDAQVPLLICRWVDQAEGHHQAEDHHQAVD